MLAFMPQSPALADGHSSPASSSMSLAILPSAPLNYNDGSEQAPPAPRPHAAKRPKLTLNTTQTPTLLGGKGSTSLRLETLSAVSPTARNTFSNAYEEEKSSAVKPQRPSLTPLATNVPEVCPGQSTPGSDQISAATDTPELTSSSSVSTLDSLCGVAPYKLAYNIKSILSNGPIPRTKSKRSSFARSRPMFPAQKRVAFKAPLTEEIKTTKYTMAHSDLDSSSSTISTLDLPAPKHNLGKTEGWQRKETKPDTAGIGDVTSAPKTGDKRESDDEDSDTCPATPVAGRRKRHREWRWTLGPIQSLEPSKDANRGKRDSFTQVDSDAECDVKL